MLPKDKKEEKDIQKVMKFKTMILLGIHNLNNKFKKINQT